VTHTATESAGTVVNATVTVGEHGISNAACNAKSGNKTSRDDRETFDNARTHDPMLDGNLTQDDEGSMTAAGQEASI
jgi:hypothetical protein